MTLPHGKKRCERIRAAFGEYLEGLLSGRARRRLEAHLQDCPACRQALETERRLFTMLGSIERHPAPAGFAARTLDAVMARRPAPARPRAWAHRSAWILAPAAALLLFAAVLQWFAPAEPPQERLRDTATIALLEGGRELSGTLQAARTVTGRIEQTARPLRESLRTLAKAERLVRSALPKEFVILFVLAGCTPVVLVLAVYRMRQKGALHHVHVTPLFC
jgi:predicted anti-sigma-YlaC factor YlaD